MFLLFACSNPLGTMLAVIAVCASFVAVVADNAALQLDKAVPAIKPVPCGVQLEESYDWARWVIQALGVLLILLALLPLLLLECVKKGGRFLYMGIVATIVLVWIGFCFLANWWIFEAYKLLATPILCST